MVAMVGGKTRKTGEGCQTVDWKPGLYPAINEE